MSSSELHKAADVIQINQRVDEEVEQQQLVMTMQQQERQQEEELLEVMSNGMNYAIDAETTVSRASTPLILDPGVDSGCVSCGIAGAEEGDDEQSTSSRRLANNNSTYISRTISSSVSIPQIPIIPTESIPPPGQGSYKLSSGPAGNPYTYGISAVDAISNAPSYILPSSSSDANLLMLQNMLNNNNALITVKEELPPSICLKDPNAVPNKRDTLTWKVRLIPRIFEVYSPLFALGNCTYKMHKSKAATMRMITFMEMGVDNVYTIECSLGGKYPNHFNAQELIQFGQDVCLGLLEAYPSMAAPVGVDSGGGMSKCTPEYLYDPSVSPQPLVQPVQEVIYNKRNRDLEGTHLPNNTPSIGATNEFKSGQFAREIKYWRQYYNTFHSGFGVTLLSQVGVRELEPLAIVEDGDSDDDREYKDIGAKEELPKEENTGGGGGAGRDNTGSVSGKISKRSIPKGKPVSSGKSVSTKASKTPVVIDLTPTMTPLLLSSNTSHNTPGTTPRDRDNSTSISHKTVSGRFVLNNNSSTNNTGYNTVLTAQQLYNQHASTSNNNISVFFLVKMQINSSF